MSSLQDEIKNFLKSDEAKLLKKAARQKTSGPGALLRNDAQKAAFDLGHDLTRWKQYPSDDKKWTCYCRACGAFAIVYDYVPAGDQVAGAALNKQCQQSSLLSALSDVREEE